MCACVCACVAVCTTHMPAGRLNRELRRCSASQCALESGLPSWPLGAPGPPQTECLSRGWPCANRPMTRSRPCIKNHQVQQSKPAPPSTSFFKKQLCYYEIQVLTLLWALRQCFCSCGRQLLLQLCCSHVSCPLLHCAATANRKMSEMPCCLDVSLLLLLLLLLLMKQNKCMTT